MTAAIPEAGTETYLSLWRGQITIRRGPKLSEIAAEVAEQYGVTIEQMRLPGTAKRFCRPRQIAMARMRAETHHSLTKIGQFFCRHHTTVMDACRTVAARRVLDVKPSQ